jgi:vancomycin resistance protein VanJ
MGVVKRLLTLACIGALIASLLAFLPQWPGDIFAPFRIQLVILGVVISCSSLVLDKSRPRKKWLVAAGVATVILSMMPVAFRLAERQGLPASGHGQPVSVVSMNVLYFNSDYNRASRLGLDQNSDVVMAFETTPEWLANLNVLDRRYPYRFSPAGLKTSGISLHAKTPFRAQLHKIGSRNAPLVKAEFSNYVVLAAHPYPPATPRLTEDLRLYIEAVDRLAKAQSKPVILAGDLNATLWSPSLAPVMRSRWQWPKGSGLTYTWPTFAPPFAIQIDHILTQGVKAGRFKVLAPVGSDHLPVRADLIL